MKKRFIDIVVPALAMLVGIAILYVIYLYEGIKDLYQRFKKFNEYR